MYNIDVFNHFPISIIIQWCKEAHVQNHVVFVAYCNHFKTSYKKKLFKIRNFPGDVWAVFNCTMHPPYRARMSKGMIQSNVTPSDTIVDSIAFPLKQSPNCVEFVFDSFQLRTLDMLHCGQNNLPLNTLLVKICMVGLSAFWYL